MFGVACDHLFWKAHMVEQCQVLHAIIALGYHSRSDDIGRSMQSFPFEYTDGQTMSGMACHHRSRTTQTVG